MIDLDHRAFDEIGGLAEKIYSEFKSLNKLRSKIIRSYLNILLLRTNLAAQEQEVSLMSRGRSQGLLAAYLSLVNDNFNSRQKVHWYASKLCVSSGHLNKVCNALTGRSASTYIQEAVIIESKRLLSFTDLSQKEIATQIGFSDIFYFNRFFKKKVGLTPGQFRSRGAKL